jgi:hypothetical protein
MKSFRCNECGLDGEGEPKTVVQDRADCSFGEVVVCPDCGSDDIDIGEFTLNGEDAPDASLSLPGDEPG